MSIREQIIEAAVTALSAGSPPAKIFRSRLEALDAANLPSIVVYAGPEKVEVESHDPVDRRVLTMHCECAVKGASPADELLDPLLVWITQTLMLDETFGGLASRCQEAGSEPMMVEADADIASRLLSFEITYFTSRADQSVAG